MHNYLILYQIPSILPIVKALVIQELPIQEMGVIGQKVCVTNPNKLENL